MVNKITGIKILVVPVAVALALLASILYVKPAYDEMQSAKKEQARLKDQQSKLEDQNKKLSDLKTKWEAMSDERTLVDGSIPVDTSIDYYLSQLYEQASKSGVLLSSVSKNIKSELGESYACGAKVGPEVSQSISSSQDDASGAETTSAPKKSKSAATGSPCANVVSINVEINGSWDQVLNFLKYLESTNRIANVSSIEISGSTSNDLLRVKIQTSVYFKDKTSNGSSTLASGLMSGKGFEEGVIKKLNAIIFAPYVAPSVSETGERNIFK